MQMIISGFVKKKRQKNLLNIEFVRVMNIIKKELGIHKLQLMEIYYEMLRNMILMSKFFFSLSLTVPIKTSSFRYWCAIHVLQTQYTIQIIRCNSVTCCGPWRSNYIQIFPHRFLPAPVAFERTQRGIAMAERDYQKGVFYGSLIQRIQFHGVVMQHTQNDILPFDYCCSSVRKELKRRVCPICKQYIPSAYRMKNHYRIHQQQYASNSLEYNDEILTIENDEEDADMINSQRPLPGGI